MIRFTFFISSLFCSMVFGQQYENFYETKSNLDPYYDSLIQVNGLDSMRGTGYTQYKRWVDYWEPILYPHGDFSIGMQIQEYT